MNTTIKTLTIAIMLIVLGAVLVNCVQTACNRENPSIASCR